NKTKDKGRTAEISPGLQSWCKPAQPRPTFRTQISVGQQSLFPLNLPEGFLYQANFLRIHEEAGLLRKIAHENFQALDFHGYTARRRTVEFGLEYDFASRKATPTRAFPDY